MRIDDAISVTTKDNTITVKQTAQSSAVKIQDTYQSADATPPITYEKPKLDQVTIAKLKMESDQAYANLRSIVESMLRRQGMTLQDVNSGAGFIVDSKAKVDASAILAAELSPDKVSDRIIAFAKAISGGNVSQYGQLKKAIEEGFRQAAQALGSLPDISKQTFELTMSKLDKWAQGQEDTKV